MENIEQIIINEFIEHFENKHNKKCNVNFEIIDRDDDDWQSYRAFRSGRLNLKTNEQNTDSSL